MTSSTLSTSFSPAVNDLPTIMYLQPQAPFLIRFATYLYNKRATLSHAAIHGVFLACALNKAS